MEPKQINEIIKNVQNAYLNWVSFCMTVMQIPFMDELKAQRNLINIIKQKQAEIDKRLIEQGI